jgi:CCR4-NOT transcription complex subunit 1
MDPDDTHLRKAAHCMVRNLTSGLAMITCREQVIQTLTTNLKQHFMSVLIVCITSELLVKVKYN